MDQQYSSLNGKTNTEVLELLNAAQHALEDERKYHATLDHLLEGFQIIGFDWRYKYVNNTVVKQSKFTREELIGFTMMEKYPGIEHTKIFKTLRLCMDARIPSVFENEFNYPDGSSGWFELSIQPCEEGLTILSNDITERKKAEKNELEYLEGLERVLFMTSHNLRQPITHIQGLVNLLKNYRNNPEEMNKILDYMESAAGALDKYTREITGYIHGIELNAKDQA